MTSQITFYLSQILGKNYLTEDGAVLGKIKDFLIVAKEMVEKSNKEAGCKSYQLYQDPYFNNKFIFVEEYKDQSAIDAHFATDYFKAFGPKISTLVQEPGKIKIITVAKVVDK